MFLRGISPSFIDFFQWLGSEEEKEDLRDSYLKGKGDMDRIFDEVPFTTLSEEPRIRNVLEEMISNGDLPSYDCFIKEDPKKRDRRIRKVIIFSCFVYNLS